MVKPFYSSDQKLATQKRCRLPFLDGSMRCTGFAFGWSDFAALPSQTNPHCTELTFRVYFHMILCYWQCMFSYSFPKHNGHYLMENKHKGRIFT